MFIFLNALLQQFSRYGSREAKWNVDGQACLDAVRMIHLLFGLSFVLS